jgi:hypothetical protein
MIVELTRLAEADLFDAAIAYEREREGLGSRLESQVDRVFTNRNLVGQCNLRNEVELEANAERDGDLL